MDKETKELFNAIVCELDRIQDKSNAIKSTQ